MLGNHGVVYIKFVELRHICHCRSIRSSCWQRLQLSHLNHVQFDQEWDWGRQEPCGMCLNEPVIDASFFSCVCRNFWRNIPLTVQVHAVAVMACCILCCIRSVSCSQHPTHPPWSQHPTHPPWSQHPTHPPWSQHRTGPRCFQHPNPPPRYHQMQGLELLHLCRPCIIAVEVARLDCPVKSITPQPCVTFSASLPGRGVCSRCLEAFTRRISDQWLLLRAFRKSEQTSTRGTAARCRRLQSGYGWTGALTGSGSTRWNENKRTIWLGWSSRGDGVGEEGCVALPDLHSSYKKTLSWGRPDVFLDEFQVPFFPVLDPSVCVDRPYLDISLCRVVFR